MQGIEMLSLGSFKIGAILLVNVPSSSSLKVSHNKLRGFHPVLHVQFGYRKTRQAQFLLTL
jgi:hypothetical protein